MKLLHLRVVGQEHHVELVCMVEAEPAFAAFEDSFSVSSLMALATRHHGALA